MFNPKVYVIVLNWNRYGDTIRCIRSLTRSTYRNFQIVLVDNGSTDNSEAVLKRSFPEIPLIQAGKNLGYTGGNNLGIKYALKMGADLIWILNPDTVIAPDTLEKLVPVMQRKDVGLAVPIIYYLDSPKKIWFVNGRVNLLTGKVDHLHHGEIDHGQFKKEIAIGWANGAAQLIKTEVLKKIGLLDENYFLFYEDVDISIRIKRAGYKVVTVPQAKLWHKVGSSVGQGRPINTFYKLRNQLYFVRKFTGFHAAIFVFFVELLVSLKKMVKGLVYKDSRAEAIFRLEALAAFLGGNFGQKK